ncbi:MAG: hypothetical protein FWF01_00485 [Alphaproteobacteria bacterium]|nr:hypothetical protein [Alphaproteobacteria bacterium]
MFYVRVLIAVMLGLSYAANAHARADAGSFLDEIAPSPCIELTSIQEMYDQGLALLNSRQPRDLYDAADCFMAGAFRGHARSQAELARLYLEGIGVPHSPAFAYKWAIIADTEGDRSAARIRDEAKEMMNNDDFSEAKMRLGAARVWRTAHSNWLMDTDLAREEAEEANLIDRLPMHVAEQLRRELMEMDNLMRSADFDERGMTGGGGRGGAQGWQGQGGGGGRGGPQGW